MGNGTGVVCTQMGVEEGVVKYSRNPTHATKIKSRSEIAEREKLKIWKTFYNVNTKQNKSWSGVGEGGQHTRKKIIKLMCTHIKTINKKVLKRATTVLTLMKLHEKNVFIFTQTINAKLGNE